MVGFLSPVPVLLISTAAKTKAAREKNIHNHVRRRSRTRTNSFVYVVAEQKRKDSFNGGRTPPGRQGGGKLSASGQRTEKRQVKGGGDGRVGQVKEKKGRIAAATATATTIDRTDTNPYRSSAERSYPSGKLPFALELDFVLNHPISDAIIAALVTLNCLVFALQTTDLSPSLYKAFQSYEQNLSLVFLIEYFGRWYGKGLSPRYLLTRGMIIDFIAVAPVGFAFADQSEALFVRILRLSRILRIQRVFMDTDRSSEVMGSMTNVQVRLAGIGLSLFSLLYVSAGLFFQVEKDVNPNVLNFFDAFYFSTITLFTVGFGDVTPLTTLGRTITVLTVLSGAVLVPYQLSEIERVRQISVKEKELKEEDSSSSSSQDDRVFVAVANLNMECKRCFLRGHQNDARFCRNCGNLLTKRSFDR